MADKAEDEFIRKAEELESKGEKSPEGTKKAKALAREVLAHIEEQREDPIAQRKALVRLARAKSISKLLKESGLIDIRQDENMGRTIIALRADDELVDRMQRANSGEILLTPDAPLVRIFRGKEEPE